VLRLTPAGLEARTRAEEALARQLLAIVESDGDETLRTAVGALANALDRSIERGMASGRIAPSE
jgi:hypothetical protein